MNRAKHEDAVLDERMAGARAVGMLQGMLSAGSMPEHHRERAQNIADSWMQACKRQRAATNEEAAA